MTKKAILFILLVGQVFLWTGSAFISVLYKLFDFYTSVQVTLFTEVIYYVMQAIGIAFYAFCLKRAPQAARGKRYVILALSLTGFFTILALLSGNGIASVLMGLLMNLGIGILSGAYLTRLTSLIPQQDRGRVFGYSYAIGSIGTWLLSILMDGKLLQSNISPYLFIALAVLSIFLTRYLEPITIEEDDISQAEPVPFDKKLLLLALFIPLVCSLVNGIGSYMPSANLAGSLNPAFPRLFYALGLIAAGIINDRNRRFGAVCCITALIFPFIGLALRNEVDISIFLNIFGYIFYGFFSVYRVVLFADLAGKHPSLLYLAVFGLLSGRLGDALGTLGGMAFGDSQLLLTCTTAFFFVLCIPLFFALYYMLYIPCLFEKNNAEPLLNEFEAHYVFTSRQSDIFRLLIKGLSNAEISSELFLSESTVKFHIKNILKKTDCANRTELISAYKSRITHYI